MYKKINSILKKPLNPVHILVFIVIAILIVFIETQQYKAKIETFKSETIAKASRFKNANKSIYLCFYFYYNGEKVLGKTSGHDLSSSILDKFYQVKLNENNPDENEIILENEIKPDSTTLIKSGFKYVQFHKLNISTNTYEENWKWE
jgi:hypothetical protein